jgi:hypothetical protein
MLADDNTPACSGESLLEVHCEATVHMSAVRSTRWINEAATGGAEIKTDPRVVAYSDA